MCVSDIIRVILAKLYFKTAFTIHNIRDLELNNRYKYSEHWQQDL